MVLITQSSVYNQLLSSLSAADFALLRPHLEPLELPLRYELLVPNEPIEHAYFLDSGIASVVAILAGASHIELGIVGRDGMIGIPLLLDANQSPHLHYMQIAGRGHRIKSSAFRRAVGQSPTLHSLLLRYIHVFNTQTAQTAMSNGSTQFEGRLARWLLMCHDRIDGDVIPLTHDFMATMLGVRRSSVTDTLHVLEGKGLTRAARGKIAILRRAKLERAAGAAYGTAESEHERLIGRL
jgi:CRP-like cAMP-binding protein